MNDRALSELRDLARRDAELGAESARLRQRDLDVSDIRARAEAIDAFFATYSLTDEARRATVAVAREELARRNAELESASAALARSRDEDARIHAQHSVDRARDHIAVAEASMRRAEADVTSLEQKASALPDELAELERRANAQVTGARGLIDWASREHADLFVAAGQVDARRERVIREAHEIASMLLGDPTHGATVAQALERVEARLTAH